MLDWPISGGGAAMRGLRAILLLGLCLAAIPSLAADTGPPAETARAEIRAMIDRMIAASKQQDADTMVELFHPDLVMAHPGGPVIRGRDTIEPAMRATVERYSKTLTVEIVDFALHAPDTAHLMVQSWHDITDTETGNREFKPVRAFLIVKKTQNGAWQVYRDFDHAPDAAFIRRFAPDPSQ